MQILELGVSGLVTGSVFALISISIILVYKATGILNFAHGYVTAFGAFFSLGVVQAFDWPIWTVVPVSMVGCAMLSVLIEAAVIAPLRRADHTVLMVATLGVALVLEGIETKLWGDKTELFPRIAQGNAGRVGELNVSWQWVVTVVVTLLLTVGATAFFRFTITGIAMRAASANGTTVELLGVSPRMISIVSWSVAGLFAGLAAVLIAPAVAYSPSSFTLLLIQAFVAVVLGGFTSVTGALLGGYFVGITVNLYQGYVSFGSPAIFTLGLLALVLLIRPQGLFVRSGT